MRAVIAFALGIAVAALVLAVPVLADDTGSVTITMTGGSAISISLDRAQWQLGTVGPDLEYITIPPIEWCTLTVTGNSAVRTFIQGEDAKWTENPAGYEWTLSSDGLNGAHVYGLWFRISGDNTRGPEGDGYVPITKTQSEFWPYGGGASLEPDATKKFGLRLITPSSFTGGREMQAKLTIIAVAP